MAVDKGGHYKLEIMDKLCLWRSWPEVFTISEGAWLIMLVHG